MIWMLLLSTRMTKKGVAVGGAVLIVVVIVYFLKKEKDKKKKKQEDIVSSQEKLKLIPMGTIKPGMREQDRIYYSKEDIAQHQANYFYHISGVNISIMEGTILLGKTTSGKSSIFKNFWNIDPAELETIKQVIPWWQLFLPSTYDSPGFCDDFNLRDYPIISKLLHFKRYVLCFSKDITDITFALKICVALQKNHKKQIFVVRTYCEQFKSQNELQLVKQKDNSQIQKLTSDYTYFTTSFEKNQDLRDNKLLKKMLQS